MGHLCTQFPEPSHKPLVSNLFYPHGDTDSATKFGFRIGAKGTHTSRTMMLKELYSVFEAVPAQASRAAFSDAIIERNCLGKRTVSTRRLSSQRLSELYALDPDVAIYRVLRHVWEQDTAGRPLLALLCAIARDPLLSATAAPVLSLPVGAELQRSQLEAALREVTEDRLSDATIEKVIRNTSSSWAQAGNLVGRTFKKRELVRATPAAVAFGLWLGHAVGFRGAQLFSSGWIATLDCTPAKAKDLAIEAKRIGIIDLRMSGDVVDLVLDRLDPYNRRAM